MERNFRHVAESKNLALPRWTSTRACRAHFTTDPKRLQQILKNLLSNAFKFTAQGQVTMHVHDGRRRLEPGPSACSSRAGQGASRWPSPTPASASRPEKQKIIFEAFQQADAGTSRKYGGTGLGLAISRELATLLGGEIRLTSAPGQGSTFTLYLPLTYTGPASATIAPASTAVAAPADAALPVLPVAREETIPDDREAIAKDDPTLLIVEDDPHYARVLLGLARDKGFKGIVAMRGQQALSLARAVPAHRHHAGHLPARHARLDGAEQPQARSAHAAHPGADHLAGRRAPARPGPRRFHLPGQARHHRGAGAVLRPHQGLRRAAHQAPAGGRGQRRRAREHRGTARRTTTSRSPPSAPAQEAMAALLDRPFDCCVLDLRLPDMTGFELLDKVQAEPALRDVPIVVFTGKELRAEEETQLKTVAKSVVLKDVQSPERLFDETALFLHRVVADLPEAKQQLLERLHNSNEALRGRKVLVVDDDARNIFALATVLENHEMEVLTATNGRQAIELIQSTPDLDVVLMDIMMPEMDGYQTMREIRKDPRFRALPILALTAKAMKGDREKCLEAGASDYIAKPVNTEQLLSLLRVWLYR